MTMSWTFSAKKADRIASEIARVDAKLKFNPNNRKFSDYKVRLLDALMHAGVTMASDKKSTVIPIFMSLYLMYYIYSEYFKDFKNH